MADFPPTDRIEAIREATALSELSAIFGTASVHESYFRAKAVWERAIRAQQESRSVADGLPGASVVVDDQPFHVHGITHAGTATEAAFLREHVEEFLSAGTVYCEQGIRPMYFEEFPGVCEMDDYLWAADRCDELDADSHVDSENSFETVFEEMRSVTSQFREAAFSLIDSGSSMYGDRFERALGDIAAAFLTDHADHAVGESYEAFQLSAQASRDPSKLVALQEYYERTFLPQPLEREWLRRHDPELEIMSHARNERIAEYALYHAEGTDPVHLIVGAAHQPGVVYYLTEYKRTRTVPDELELF